MNYAKKNNVVVFGNLASASLARYVLENDSSYHVVAFTVDADFCNSSHFEGLPLVPFENLEDYYPPGEVLLLIPMGYQKINSVRKDRYRIAKSKQYDFVTYISSRASIWPNVKVGENTMVYEHAILQPFSIIGNNCIIRSGAHISHHCVIEDHSFIAAEVSMGGKVVLCEQSFLGVGSVIVDSIKIAPRTFVGAGSVITRSTTEDGVYVGNPGRMLEGKTAESVS